MVPATCPLLSAILSGKVSPSFRSKRELVRRNKGTDCSSRLLVSFTLPCSNEILYILDMILDLRVTYDRFLSYLGFSKYFRRLGLLTGSLSDIIDLLYLVPTQRSIIDSNLTIMRSVVSLIERIFKIKAVSENQTINSKF